MTQKNIFLAVGFVAWTIWLSSDARSAERFRSKIGNVFIKTFGA